MIRKLTAKERERVMVEARPYFATPEVRIGHGGALVCVRLRAAGFKAARSCVGTCFRAHAVNGADDLAERLQTIEIETP